MIQTLLAGVILLCMLGSMVSGIFQSRYVFSFLPKHGGYESAQKRIFSAPTGASSA